MDPSGRHVTPNKGTHTQTRDNWEHTIPIIPTSNVHTYGNTTHGSRSTHATSTHVNATGTPYYHHESSVHSSLSNHHHGTSPDGDSTAHGTPSTHPTTTSWNSDRSRSVFSIFDTPHNKLDSSETDLAGSSSTLLRYEGSRVIKVGAGVQGRAQTPVSVLRSVPQSAISGAQWATRSSSR